MSQTQSLKSGGWTPPPTSQRVPLNTSEESAARIRRETLRRLREIGNDPSRIEARLCALSREWDIERALEANAALVAMTGVYWGLKRSPGWFLLSGVVGGFLMQHAVQGWCPPLPVLRRLGFRTQKEIEDERTILKARRGDLAGLAGDPEQALRALET